jgi:hypothetical protein
MKLALAILSILLIVASSCSVNKGFEALGEYNYFEAKKQFEKAIDKKTSPAAYGLSKIYLKDDNPFHNLDSAYHYGLLAVESYNNLKEPQQQKLAEEHGYTLGVAKHQRAKISQQFYELAKRENTVQGYKEFIANHPWSNLKDSAVYERNLLAFKNAKKINSSKAYDNYLRFYPESQQLEEAKKLKYKAEFEETIIPSVTSSYTDFINRFPSNPYVDDAQARIYQLETKGNTIKVYDQFIKNYPNNPYLSDAWKNLYRLYISDYDKKTIESFQNTYPNFPFPQLIERDIQLVGREMFLYKLNGKYGFMDETGLPYIPAKYTYASNFSNGLAVVTEAETFGFINKNGELIIDYRFDDAQDFMHGRAIVEVDGKIGLIDPTGKYILAPIYEDIGSFSEGVFYVQTEQGYQYFNLEGNPVFDIYFDEAFSFENGTAYVSKDGENGYIGKDGNFLISSHKGRIRHFNDSIYILELRDSMTFVYPNDSLVNGMYFEKIGSLKEQRAIVLNKGAYGYVDETAQIVIPMELVEYSNLFQFAQFENGHAKKMKGNKYSLIDTLGKQILPAIFTGVGNYSELIPVSKGDGWGFTNRDARLIINYQFDYAYSFESEIAFVEKQGEMGAINTKGDVIIPIRFDDLNRFNSNLSIYKLGGNMGIVNETGVEVVPNKYNRVVPLTENLLRLENSEKIDYFDVSKSRLITLQVEDE